MDNLLFVPDIMARYKCTAQTARKRIRQMRHLEKPLCAPEWAVAEWENGKLVNPMGQKRTAVKPLKTQKNEHIPYRR